METTLKRHQIQLKDVGLKGIPKDRAHMNRLSKHIKILRKIFSMSFSSKIPYTVDDEVMIGPGHVFSRRAGGPDMPRFPSM